MENIVEIKNLKKYFKDVKAVDDISFSIKKGQLFAFLGLNGAGKSTTINIVCGILNKDSGSVLIDSHNVDTDMDVIKPKIGVVFQHSVLDGNLSVYDNLKYRAALYGINKENLKNRINYLASKLEFDDILSRSVSKLSGGQKRRIDIARALIHNPKILILDEPTTGLDPKTRILVWNFINELIIKENLTVLLTTHYMEEASNAGWVVIIDSGKIVASDTPNNLKNKYAKDYIKIYQYNTDWANKIIPLNSNIKKLDQYIEVQVDSTKDALSFVNKYQDNIFDFEIIKGNMDNVFLNVTGKALKE